MITHSAYLLLGGNLGEIEQTFSSARSLIKTLIGDIIKSSSLYRTEPWGFNSAHWFLNQALSVQTHLSPQDLLYGINAIEDKLGRNRDQDNDYASRFIDIDILLYDSLIIKKSHLIIPHIHLPERKFALLPLSEIARNFVHPETGDNIETMLEYCSDKSAIKKYPLGNKKL